MQKVITILLILKQKHVQHINITAAIAEVGLHICYTLFFLMRGSKNSCFRCKLKYNVDYLVVLSYFK